MFKHKNGIVLRKITNYDLGDLMALKNESWRSTHKTTILNDSNQADWFKSVNSDHSCLHMMAVVPPPATVNVSDPSAPLQYSPLSRPIFGDPFGEDSTWKWPKIGLYKISNIDNISRCYDSAHDVLKAKRGQGYGNKVLEAGVDFGFEILNIHRITSEILEFNVASIKNCEKAGFVVEGKKRKAIYKNGKYVDSIVVGLVREDWLELPRIKEGGSMFLEN